MDTPESPKAAAAYYAYESLGDVRSLRKLAEQIQPDHAKRSSRVRQLQEWSATYGWQDRIKAFDADRAAERRRVEVDALRKMNDRMAQIGVMQQSVALKQIQTLISAEKFGSQASVALLKLATDLERLARGAATSIEEQQHTGAVGVGLVTLDQLAALQRQATQDVSTWKAEQHYATDDLGPA